MPTFYIGTIPGIRRTLKMLILMMIEDEDDGDDGGGGEDFCMVAQLVRV